MVSVVIHTNVALGNQRETAGWLQQGFERHGVSAHVTPDKHAEADVHVVQGPHYCFDYWRERADTHRVLWLNRTYYGHPRFMISLGWLRPDGGRDFRNRSAVDGKGLPPKIKARKEECRRAAVFSDWGRDPIADIERALAKYDEVQFRPHPEERDISVSVPVMAKPRWGLDAVFAWADVAVGHSTTALVDARINGLHVDCSDPHNPVVDDPDDDDLWINRLSWANWSMDELVRGDFIPHLIGSME